MVRRRCLFPAGGLSCCQGLTTVWGGEGEGGRRAEGKGLQGAGSEGQRWLGGSCQELGEIYAPRDQGMRLQCGHQGTPSRKCLPAFVWGSREPW